MDFSFILDPGYQSYFIEGFVNTLALVFWSGLAGMVLAVLVALGLVAGPMPLRWLLRGFTTVIRGTPLLVQLFFFYDGVGRLLTSVPAIRESMFRPLLNDAFFFGAVAFSVSVAAYSGEVLRAAMMNVPKAELEAARSFGMSRTRMVRRIWLPRAVQLCLPTLTGEMILLLKSVPLVSTIAVVDLLKAANIVRSETFLVYEPLLLVAGIFVAMTLVLTAAMNLLERRFPGARPARRKTTDIKLGA
ncbi:ABC transporter permease subunit [Paracoccus sp. Z330]|uniref:ABC transporter permease subunit n=1 Tax=Paracoccus onchidii TaxID=3017813 RepID=A0ABT4ZHR6_9RHOB|nr:ABC transporter permease subunit [Paracoccus onchidii]MDB6178291.1 ABC transporter permease subunit [Paracoccus onchidii]